MNNDILQYLVNLAIFIPFVVVVIVVSIRFSKGNLEGIGIYKYTKIIERTSLNKDTDLFVLKIGDEGCVIISSPSKLEKIKDLSIDEMNYIEEKREQVKNKNLMKLDKININLSRINLKNIKLKEKKNGDNN